MSLKSQLGLYLVETVEESQINDKNTKIDEYRIISSSVKEAAEIVEEAIQNTNFIIISVRFLTYFSEMKSNRYQIVSVKNG